MRKKFLASIGIAIALFVFGLSPSFGQNPQIRFADDSNQTAALLDTMGNLFLYTDLSTPLDENVATITVDTAQKNYTIRDNSAVVLFNLVQTGTNRGKLQIHGTLQEGDKGETPPSASDFYCVKNDQGQVIMSLTSSGELRLKGQLVGKSATPVWTPLEGYWTALTSPAGWAHRDMAYAGGSGGGLAYDGRSYSSLSMSADIKITDYTPGTYRTVGFIVGARSLRAYGEWGPGIRIEFNASGILDILDLQDNGTMTTSLGSISKPNPFAPYNTTVNLHVRVTGQTISVYINDSSESSAPSISFVASHPVIGQVGLSNFNSLAEFRNIAISGTNASVANLPTPVYTPTAGTLAPPITPLSRISANVVPNSGGQFLMGGSQVHPVGFVYDIQDGPHDHGVFNVGTYDSSDMQTTLTAFASYITGTKCIRVWAWGLQNFATGGGSAGTINALPLNKAYMDNFIDFLRLATQAGLHVQAVIDDAPLNYAGLSIIENTWTNDPAYLIGKTNRWFLGNEYVEYKIRRVKEFINYIKQTDPGLLKTVFNWELANESFLRLSEGPFNRTSGIVMLSDHTTYDLSSKAQRQALAEHGIQLFTSRLADAIHEVDPDALVSMSTGASQRRPKVEENSQYYYNFAYDQPMDWPRVWVRPSILADTANSGLDMFDVHAAGYPGADFSDFTDEQEYAHELTLTRSFGTPSVVGETAITGHEILNNQIQYPPSLAWANQIFTFMGLLSAKGYQGGYYSGWVTGWHSDYYWLELWSSPPPLYWP